MAITILTSCPNADPEEVLREAKKAILNMRQDCRENVIAAVRENLLSRGDQNPSEGIRDNSNEAGAAQMETFSQEHLPRPEPEHFLCGNAEVIDWLCRGQLPAFKEMMAKQRKEARRQIRDGARCFLFEEGRLWKLDAPPKRKNQVQGPVRRPERTDGRKLTSTEVDLPLEKVGFDLLGPFPPTTEGYEYVYIWYDYFSGWIGAGLGRTKQSAGVAEFLKMDLFAAHACPALISMDNDAHVGEVKNLCQRIGTQVQVIVPYSPWMNGGAESSVKIFTKNVRKLVIQYGPDWVSHIYEALLVIRVCYRTATRMSPFEIIYGRQPVLPAERLLVARFRISQSSTSEGEERAEREFDAAVQGINCGIRRVNILLRQAHQANMRATAARTGTSRRSEQKPLTKGASTGESTGSPTSNRDSWSS
ncbi:protein with retrovirus polyprotein and Retrovirus zinc finger-like domains [Klebsormidium nitens]|uniref:Protein with retrovirus polyprotein and Retrovirus zinc finger-like domains n=1 Tax=Klebsormidium nitens TaxID=105231 RepID=A0A1Y1IQ60_KLENI|nr:protein with retrovirus polyprotein and Retrovirus zinc finger-like domains [Klebsormidium nitens]|eukprot:GAQ93000.1 protein with retrovirus polyprotein and Retrovirus zinc finger-like domains [Klebsormidium nitens]